MTTLTAPTPAGGATAIAPLSEMVLIAREESEAVELEAMSHGTPPAGMDPDIEYVNWFLGQLAKIEAVREQIRAQSKAMLARLDAREGWLGHQHGPKVQKIVDAALAKQGGKKKSVQFLTGTAGYRVKPERVVVTDERALVDWCSENCPDALDVKVARTTPIKDHIKGTGEVPPGVELKEPTNEFYPAFHQLAFGADFWKAIEAQKGGQS